MARSPYSSTYNCPIVSWDRVDLWNVSFSSALGHAETLSGFIVRLQAVSRTYLCKHRDTSFASTPRLSHVSSAPSLTCLARGARYARSEAALRDALSRCDTEPSPLQLQVRVMEKGLQAWNMRVARAYERVRKAEETLGAIPLEGTYDARGSLGELQREKWMGMKERDEALVMVEKIKVLITQLNADIKSGLKAKSTSKSPGSPTAEGRGTDLPYATASKKAPILFSGRFPQPYLENLPRSRRSVEPLRLPLRQSQVTNASDTQRSPARSEHIGSDPLPPNHTTHSTPPATSPSEYGAAFIHRSLQLKTMTEYLVEMEEMEANSSEERHMKLPSYVDVLLDELSKDRIGNQSLNFDDDLQSLSPVLSGTTLTPMTPAHNHSIPPPASPIKKPQSKRLFGRPFSAISNTSSLLSSSQDVRSKENHDPSHKAEQEHPVNSITTFEKLLHVPSNVKPESSPSFASPTLDTPFIPRKQQARIPGRIESMVQSVKKNVKKVSGRGE
ncbi:hypothetical protein K439DRAFT_799596 [Ramaria rubella]|nr:hypothetical protein K439DRAFT_799596 [Ramaria rubella]